MRSGLSSDSFRGGTPGVNIQHFPSGQGQPVLAGIHRQIIFHRSPDFRFLMATDFTPSEVPVPTCDSGRKHGLPLPLPDQRTHSAAGRQYEAAKCYGNAGRVNSRTRFCFVIRFPVQHFVRMRESPVHSWASFPFPLRSIVGVALLRALDEPDALPPEKPRFPASLRAPACLRAIL